MIMMASVLCLVVLLAISTASASDVPVLMWSPDRPLSDLPQAPAADKISHDVFHNNYLKHLLGKETNVVVAFMQDKLHINDISKYADVYSHHSNGGAFKNIKGLLDEHFSLELPHVLGSHIALDALRRDFPGTVHDVASASAFSDLDINGSENYLVIVHLLPVADAKNSEMAIAQNDKLIGQVSKHLQERSVKYTALYTAETSEERLKRDTRQARHLLEVPPEAVDDGVFYNVTYDNSTMIAFLTSVSICIIENPNGGQLPDDCGTKITVDTEQLKNSIITPSFANRTLNASLQIDNIKSNQTTATYNVTFMLPFKLQYDRWEILDAQLTVTNSSAGDMVYDDNMVIRGYDGVVSVLYSFHCTSMIWYPKNTTNPVLAYITLEGFQVQPFNVVGDKFLLSQDCVGWFSIGIWMALFIIGIHLVILFFGMYMVASLSTNDRFDDPKGKPLTINAGD